MIMSYSNDLLMVQSFKTVLKKDTSQEAFRGTLVMSILSQMGRARINTLYSYQLLVVNLIYKAQCRAIPIAYNMYNTINISFYNEKTEL